MTDDKPARRTADKPELETDLRDALQEVDRRLGVDLGPDPVVDIVKRFGLSYCTGNAVWLIVNNRATGINLSQRVKDLERAKQYIQHEIDSL